MGKHSRRKPKCRGRRSKLFQGRPESYEDVNVKWNCLSSHGLQCEPGFFALSKYWRSKGKRTFWIKSYPRFLMPRIFKVIYSYLVQRQTHHCTQRTPWDYRKAVLLTVKWEVQGKAMWICTLTLLSQIPSLAVPTRCNLRGCTFKCWSATRRNESNTARTLRPSELSKQNHKCYSKLGLRTQYPGF